METLLEYDDDFIVIGKLHENGLSIQFQIMENGEIEVEGSLDWEGCMDWRTAGSNYCHFCEPAHAERLMRIFADIWKLGPKRIRDYCG